MMVWLDRKSGWKQKDRDARSPGDVDYARVVHSASFRRLQGKTQILSLGDSDEIIYRRSTQLVALRQEKSALMQQLLTGKRRVKLEEMVAA